MIGKHKKLLLTAWLSIGLFCTQLYAQTTIKGVVISASDNKPIEGATIIVKGSEKGTQTNATGEFALAGKTGDQIINQFNWFFQSGHHHQKRSLCFDHFACNSQK